MTAGHTYKLAAYPKEISLRDRTSVVIKPMSSADADPLLQFFRRILAEDRYYLIPGQGLP